MNASAFLDRSSPPSDRDGVAVLGDAAPRWVRLTRILTELGAHGVVRWDGPRSGWCVPVKRAGRPLVTLTPRPDGFDALVVLGRAEADLARGVALGEATREILTDSPQLHDGRWLFLSIASDADADDLLRLLSVKLPARVRAKLDLSNHVGLPV
jgi:Protein of unknown function (DUF3788)